MPAYRAAVVSATPANGAAYWSFNSPTRRAKILELTAGLTTAVFSQIELGTPANEATPPVVSTSTTPENADPADIAATARIGTAWTTAPTAPTVFRSGAPLAAVIGSGWVWAWPDRLGDTLKIAGWRVLWNRGGSTGSPALIAITYEE